MHKLFITSVGTGIGKTLVTATLCHQLRSAGRAVRAIKPVVSGFTFDDSASDPALILQSLGRIPNPQSIAAIAPWRFAQPISPHLAARQEGRAIAIDEVVAFCREQEPGPGGVLLIEGAGGVMTPLDDAHTGLDLIARLGYPVILVTGSYLGALSHTLTALAAIRGRGVSVLGIVVCESESEASVGLNDTVESLRSFAGADVNCLAGFREVQPPGEPHAKAARTEPRPPGITKHDRALLALPRLTGSDEEKWRAAPRLLDLCSGEKD